MSTLQRKVFGGGSCPSCAGISVDLATGNLTASSRSTGLPGLGFPVELDYTYDTQDSYEGIFGRGRSRLGEVGQRLTELTGIVVVHRETGDDIVFTDDGEGGWEAPSGVGSTLTENGDGSWTEVRDRGFTVEYDSDGRVQSMADTHSNVHYYEYDPVEVDRVVAISDASERYCYFEYDAVGQVTGLKDLDKENEFALEGLNTLVRRSGLSGNVA
jgi:hypothetical protein